ncbi:protein S40-4-like [Phragmites australis]|uniref:protein S40-4-like n=1 Tax=Phragmites australis TaxID=29695 RepID=UPI002D76603C|nr:protein S40-4-like [Phragmites australis]
MAGRSGVSMVAAHRLFAPARAPHAAAADQGVELDEADVIWGGTGASSLSPSSVSPFLHSSAADPYAWSPPVAAPSKPKPRGGGGPGPASVPVNIPDWSKILGAEYAGSCAGAGARGWAAHDDRADAEEVGGRSWVPPHEMLQCRERAAASFSVREGAGRTLKGRDLRRVRNAIWEKTGFQD